MKLQVIKMGIILLMSFINCYADPMIRSIKNETPFKFKVVGHNDMSGCSEFHDGKDVEIYSFDTYTKPLLLGFEKPGLLLRPVAYCDEKTAICYSLVDDKDQFDFDKLNIAFDVWKKNNGIKYKKSIDTWFKEWLCGDISLIHNHVEIMGYIQNVELTRIENNKNFHVCLIDYSEGLFSRLLIDITIKQKSNKGIIPFVKSFVGQGGFCKDGKVVAVR